MGASAPTPIRKLMRNNKKILDYDPATGILETFHYDHVEDKAIIETSQDITAILEANKRAYNQVDENARWEGDVVLAASVPNIILAGLPKELKRDQNAFKKWLNHPDQKAFKLRPGKI